MADVPNDLLFRRNWWWDPIDMEFFRRLEQPIQREVLSISLQTQAQILKTQAVGLEKMSEALRKS
jgi:hypothetical protein